MFSLEMSAGQLAARLLSTESGVDSSRLRLGRLNEQESLKLTHALGVLYEAPIYVSWANANRSAMIRVPNIKPGKEKSTRIELRMPDPACNPYLAFAVMLGAGLKGIEEGLEPVEPVENMNIYHMTEEERHERGIDSLPEDLGHAIQLASQSELVRETLGEHVFEQFLRNKRAIWSEARAHVTRAEVDHYLPIL